MLETKGIKKTFFAVNASDKWLAATKGTDEDNVIKQLLECFLSNEALRKRLPDWMNGGYKVRERVEPIEIEVWVPDPDKPGYLQYDHNKTIGEIERELKVRIKADGYCEYLDYFSISAVLNEKEVRSQPWPKCRWIACYAVIGDSEGYYVHVDIIYRDHDVIVDPFGKNEDVWCRRLIFLGKIFSGHDMAWEIARACANHLGA